MTPHTFRLLFVKSVVCLATLLTAASAMAGLNLKVVDDKGNTIDDFRWILQEDISHPGVPYVRKNDTVSIVAHNTDARVIAEGRATSSTLPIRVPKYTLPKLVPDGTQIAGATTPSYADHYNDLNFDSDPDSTKPYVISVMASGYSTGGQQVKVDQHEVTVVLNKNPLPTTQVSILVFHDYLPLNNEPDEEEEGLPGFRIKLYDYLGGPFIQDAWANPIGTEYTTDAHGNVKVDADGAPVEILKRGDGFLYTDKDGKALIKNMWAAKFGIEVIPPTGENWNGGHAAMKTDGYYGQTATIEGTPTIDAWGAANGSRVFIEGWGAGFYHVFFGFNDPAKLPGAAPATGNSSTVTGKLVVNHYGRPPFTAAVAEGPPVTEGWVGLNKAVDLGGAGAPVEGVDKALLPGNKAVITLPCDPETGVFTIPNVAPGKYQLVSWDKTLDCIWNSVDIEVPADGSTVHVPPILMTRWFGTLEGKVFYDSNKNGFPDSTETENLPQWPLNIRYRDGSIYQSTVTDSKGEYAFTEVFPFFKWLIAEVGFTRGKPTGMTAVVDDGGKIPTTGPAAPYAEGVRNPQRQREVNADGSLGADILNPVTGDPFAITATTETPSTPLLLQAIQVYNGQNDRIDWGFVNYEEGQHGGIAGVVGYGNTRAESDPRNTTIEPWEPGVPRAVVTLYDTAPNYADLAKTHSDQLASIGQTMATVYGKPADINLWKIKIHSPRYLKPADLPTGTYTTDADGYVLDSLNTRILRPPRLADVDNWPFGWKEGTKARGPEDVDQDDPTHTLLADSHPFNPGDAIQIVHSDSWDDDIANQTDPNFPSAGGYPAGTIQPSPPEIDLGVSPKRKVIGSDNFATWEQIRPGVFDGGYLVNSYFPKGMANYVESDLDSHEKDYMPPGDYVVEVNPPRGYLIQTEQSRNIVYGDSYKPGKLDLPPECIGDFQLVPPYLDLFTDQQAPSDFANQWRPMANRKLVTVVQSRNSPCDFQIYTEVPKASHCVGFVLNDLSAEFNPNSPSQGEREGAAWIPVSFRDWAGHEVARTYSDEYGCYEAMLPSTYNAAVPCPSGFAPNMLTVILNDPTIPSNPDGQTGPRVPDPFFNPGFVTAPVVLEYFPGKLNYADTPVVPIGAFVGSPNAPLDVEPPDGTPVIKSVTAAGHPGPVVTSLSETITITAMGPTQVLDPTYKLHDPYNTNPNGNKITRDFGFGSTPGTVTLAPTTTPINGFTVPSGSVAWTEWAININLATVPLSSGTPTVTGGTEWQLMVTRGSGVNAKTTPIGVTLSYEPNIGARLHVVMPQTPLDGSTLTSAIQQAIDDPSLVPGDLVIVPPGMYLEYPIMDKAIRLQGSGAATVINGTPDPQSRVPSWHNTILAKLGEDPFIINECPGIQVLGETAANRAGFPAPPFANNAPNMARVDGFNVTAAVHGGGLNVYNQARHLRVSNNRFAGNMGDSYNGGISIGAPGGNEVTALLGVDTSYDNTNVVIEYNQVLMNSSLDGAGGIAIHTGANGYKIRNNYIMGNFTFDAPGATAQRFGAGMGGGGILHMGLSPGGLIANNVIAYNEIFFGYSTGGGDGGGIAIQGEANGSPGTGTSGSGSVTIANNLIMGNLAAAGLGGGIRLEGVNGPEMVRRQQDAVAVPGTIGTPSSRSADWYEINIINNMIVNNVAGFGGAGISMQDAIKVNIVGNTIVNNDAPAVALNTFPDGKGGKSVSPGGAGILIHANSSAIPTGLSSPYNKGNSTPLTFKNNIIWHNSTYRFDYGLIGTPYQDPNNHMPIDDTSAGLTDKAYSEVAVTGGSSFLPDTSNYSNESDIPPFKTSYNNILKTALVYDEGGNNSISLRFESIGIFKPSGSSGGTGLPTADYHLSGSFSNSTLSKLTSPAGVALDYDGQTRPGGAGSANYWDYGADDFVPGGPAQPILPGSANDGLNVAIVGLIADPTLSPLQLADPVPEVNPLIAPGDPVPSAPINPVWLTADPGGLALFVESDIQSLTAFAFRLQAQGTAVNLEKIAVGAENELVLAAHRDPVAKYIFEHLRGTWPVAAEVVPTPTTPNDTKGWLALYAGGADPNLMSLLVTDLNSMIRLQGALNNNNTIYNLVTAPGQQGYTASDRTLQLYAALPPSSLFNPAASIHDQALILLNRSVIQDAFSEIRRWYDPNVAYIHLVCGDGFAKMADGTELYCFGFSDQTSVANNPGNQSDKGPDKVLAAALANATFSAPTMVVNQDQEFHLDLSNVGFAYRPDLFDPHTVHFHGFPNAAPIFDGMPLASISVLEGATLPYFYKVQVEGTYFYHCHVEATEHMQMGMIGNLWVEARQSFTGHPNKDGSGGTVPVARLGGATSGPLGYAYNDGDGTTAFDVEVPIQVTGFDHYFHDEEMSINPTAFSTLFDTYPLINGRGYPDTIKTDSVVNSLGFESQKVHSLITANSGQKILIRYSNVSETDFGTLTVPNIPMTVIGKDARLLRGPSPDGGTTPGKNLYYRTTSVTLGGGETADMILDTTGIPEGTYFLYAARLTQLSNDEEDYGGMMTEIHIGPAIPPTASN